MASEYQPIGAALSMGLGAIGSALGIGMLANGALQSLGRNPEAVSYTHLTLPTNREV